MTLLMLIPATALAEEGALCLPSALQSIDGGALEGCAALTSVRVPESVRSIGE
jgi:hypothetical protein